MGKWLDKTGLTQIKGLLATKFSTKVDKYPGAGAGKYLQTDNNGNAFWGDPVSVNDIKDATEDWLEANISFGTTEVIALDASLSEPGAAADAKSAGDLITVSDTTPTSGPNKLWIKRTPESEVTVPTYDEFTDLKSAITKDENSIVGMFNDGEFVFKNKRTITAPETVWFEGTFSNGLSFDVKLLSYSGSYLNGCQVVGTANGTDEIILSKSSWQPGQTFTVTLGKAYSRIGIYIRQSTSETATVAFEFNSKHIAAINGRLLTVETGLASAQTEINTAKQNLAKDEHSIIGMFTEGEFVLKDKRTITAPETIWFDGVFPNGLSFDATLISYSGSYLNGCQVVGTVNGTDEIILSKSSWSAGQTYTVTLGKSYDRVGMYIRQSTSETATTAFEFRSNHIEAIKDRITAIEEIIHADDFRWEQGGVNADGTINDSPNWCHSTFVSGKRLIASFTGYHVNLNQYDNDGTWIDVSGSNNALNIPLNYGSKYIIAIRNADTTAITPDDVEEDVTVTISNGLLYACGDSITYGANNDGVSYINYACQRLGITLQKFAQTGATWVLTPRPDTGYRPNILTFVDSMISADVEPDFIVMSGGYNDSQNAILNTIGTVEQMGEGKDPHDVYGTTSVNPFSTDTVVGAIEHSILALRNKYPNAQFLYVITYRITSEYHWQNEYAPAIREVLDKWAIPYVDFTKVGNLVRSAGLPDMTNIFTDNVHPNRKGYEIMANYVESALKSNFNIH